MNENLDRVAKVRGELAKLRSEKDAVIAEIKPLVQDQIHYLRGRSDPNESVRVKFEVLDDLNQRISDALAEYSALSLALSEEWLHRMADSTDRLENLTKRLNQFTKALLLVTGVLVAVSVLDLLLRIGGHV